MAKPVMRGKAGRGGFAELVFGLAITQISHTLLYDHGLKGAVEVGVSVPRGVGRPDLFRLGFEPTGPRCHFRVWPLVRFDAGRSSCRWHSRKHMAQEGRSCAVLRRNSDRRTVFIW